MATFTGQLGTKFSKLGNIQLGVVPIVTDSTSVNSSKFNFWLYNSPVVQSGNSREFDKWWKDAPVLQISGITLGIKYKIVLESGASLKADGTIYPEWLTKLDEKYRLTFESSGIWQRLDATIPVEWDGTVDVKQTLPLEFRATLVERFGLLPEWTLGITARCPIPFEFRGWQTLISKLPFEFSSDVVFVTNDSTIPFDFSASIHADHTLNLEWLVTLPRDLHTFPLEFTTGLRELLKAPLEWKSIIQLTAKMPIEWSGYSPVGSLLSIPTEWLSQIGVDILDTIPIEFSGLSPLELWVLWNVIRKLSTRFDLDWKVLETAAGISFPLKWRVFRSLPTLNLQWNVLPAQVFIDSDIQKPVASGEKTP